MARPLLLFLLLLLPPLGWLAYCHWQWQAGALGRLGSTRWRQAAQPDDHWLNWQNGRWLLAIALGIVALAGPQWGQTIRRVETHSLQVMILLDVSRSMLAEDVPGNRLGQANAIVETAVNALNEADQVGLTAFAGEARLLLPLTSARSQVTALSSKLTPAEFTPQGTVLGSALAAAVQSFPYPRAGQPVILLITDGEEHGGGSLPEASQAAQQDVILVAIGVGTEAGALLPMPDSAGQPVLSQRNSDFLQTVAGAGNGRYLSADEAILTLPDQLQEIRQSYTGVQTAVEPRQRYQLFLCLSLLLFCLNWIPLKRTKVATAAAGLAGALLFSAGLSGCQADDMAGKITQGNEAFTLSAYEQAMENYTAVLTQDPQSAVALFNLANVQYRLGAFETAVSQLQQIPEEESETIRADVFFNLGNSYFQMADYLAAVGAYQAALRLNPNDLDAKHNLELALEKLRLNEEASASYPAAEQSQHNPQNPAEEPSPPQPHFAPAEPLAESPTLPLVEADALRIIYGMQADTAVLPINTESNQEVNIERTPAKDW